MNEEIKANLVCLTVIIIGFLLLRHLFGSTVALIIWACLAFAPSDYNVFRILGNYCRSVWTK